MGGSPPSTQKRRRIVIERLLREQRTRRPDCGLSSQSQDTAYTNRTPKHGMKVGFVHVDIAPLVLRSNRTDKQNYLLPSTPRIPPALPCILVGTRSLNPLNPSLDDSALDALFLGLRLRKLLASFSSNASSSSTLGPPSMWSSRICCREPAAWSSAFPAGG